MDLEIKERARKAFLDSKSPYGFNLMATIVNKQLALCLHGNRELTVWQDVIELLITLLPPDNGKSDTVTAGQPRTQTYLRAATTAVTVEILFYFESVFEQGYFEKIPMPKMSIESLASGTEKVLLTGGAFCNVRHEDNNLRLIEHDEIRFGPREKKE